MKLYPLKLNVIYNQTIWQNDNLKRLRNLQECAGTSWEVSAHNFADNIILNGEFKGKGLTELIKEYPHDMLGKFELKDMLRAAMLDAKGSLSIQVHPDEEYAVINENDHGKTEAWYIIDAKENATLVAGINLNNVDEIKEAVKNESIEKYVNNVPVKKGDFVLIPAGMLHALGAGILAIEIGTNSNTTYRFYDYHRKDDKGNERPLHLKKSLDVVNCDYTTKVVNGPGKILDDTFTIELIDDEKYSLVPNKETFYIVTNLGKDMIYSYNNIEYKFDYLQSIFIPSNCDNINFSQNERIMISYRK
jgi:mannose-6-phosphate isomerase